jgi:hypothetical protein
MLQSQLKKLQSQMLKPELSSKHKQLQALYHQNLLKETNYKSKILDLLTNQPEIQKDYWNIRKGSNCYGTIIHLLNGQDRVKQIWGEAGNDLNKNNIYIEDCIMDYIDSPQYVGPKPYKLFLESELTQIEEIESNCIITYKWAQLNSLHNRGFILRHTAMVLKHDKKNPEKTWMFHQRGLGLEFQLTPMNQFLNKITNQNEKNISKVTQTIRDSLEINFWK